MFVDDDGCVWRLFRKDKDKDKEEGLFLGMNVPSCRSLLMRRFFSLISFSSSDVREVFVVDSSNCN